MSTPILEPLPGLASKYKRQQNWEGLQVQTSASQLEARYQAQSFARYSWELVFNYLNLTQRGTYTDAIAAGNFQYLMGFFANLGGALSSFFYRDQEDNTAIGASIGTGDGSTLTFQARRDFGSNFQPVYGFDARGAIQYGPYLQPASQTQVAYDNGSPVAGATFDSETGIITYPSAPANGHALTADFSYLWRCRFTENTLDFDRLWNVVYGITSMKIIQVLAP